MSVISSYPQPARALVDTDEVLGAADLPTNAIPISALLSYLRDAIITTNLLGGDDAKAPSVAAVEAAIVDILTGQSAMTLTDESTGQQVTGRLILSGGVLKFAPAS